MSVSSVEVGVEIARMATDLPPPLNGILSLWLPPDFVQKKENTLGFVLGQEELTWEALVVSLNFHLQILGAQDVQDLLHVFSQNLLVPCAYPNPVPSLSQFHLPVPPLPSHYPPLVIYTFCASLHSLLLSIEPDGSGAGVDAERWALMQRTPGSSGGDWFTSSVDIRSIGDALEKENVKQESDDEKGTLLERWAATGDKFGMFSHCAQGVFYLKEGRIRLGSSYTIRYEGSKLQYSYSTDTVGVAHTSGES